ncbi:MAG TPA: HEAT repeat domain-containing protein, partial [Polyangiaceae bacterium]|nr:HEAT repeat domain-containing protein [Polyangiaceae bacterium]
MFDDLYVLRDRGRAAAARGDLDTAIAALLAAAGQTHVAEHDYSAVLRLLEETLAKRGDTRGALNVVAYLASVDSTAYKRAEALLPHVPHVDRAPVLAAQGRMAEAAREMESAGQVAAAAIYREKARDWVAARALWSRLALVTEHDDDAYVTALVRFNLARCARQCGDAHQARDAIVASVRLLEEAADHFESIGRRERAFDCFQVLVQIGRESGAFEDVLEGFVNSIRILRADHLKYDFALKLFDESIAAATESGETRAAATLARQAAEYARSLGLAQAATQYSLQQADLWRAVAKQHLSRGGAAEVAENAMLAAILAFDEINQYGRVGDLFAELGQLDLEPSRRAHYARAAGRYEMVKDEPIQKLGTRPPARRPDTQNTEVWHVDVLEWERQGSAVQACGDVLFDKRWSDLIRRKAMVARLIALDVEGRPDDASPRVLEGRLRLIEQLAQLQLYVLLSPLEKLFERPERRTKIAVLQALHTFCYKRSFVTVGAALRDPDPVIVDQAANAVEVLSFPHAVDPLSRIMRESPQAAVRAAALRALAHVDTLEAAELVLGVLEYGAPADRAAALAAVKAARGSTFLELARAALPTAT